MSRALLFLSLISFLALTGCGGGGSESGTGATPAATSVGIKVSPTTSITTDESGRAVVLSVTLGSQPADDVTIQVSSSDTTEGTANPASLTFTSANWSTAQEITVAGASDDSNDGNQNYTIHLGPAKSTDSSYNALEKTLPAVNLDVRKSSFIVTPSSGTTTENGGSFTFSVSLGYAPSAEVRIPTITGLPTEGTINKSELIFSTSNWKTPQSITVTGVGDTSPGDQTYSIKLGPAQSTDATYNNLVPPEVTVTNTNYKSGLVDISNISGSQTDEAGGQVFFQVQLHSKPVANVSIPVESSKTSEGIVSTASLTFTPDDWDKPQTVTVTGVEDPFADGTQSYTILLGLTSSADDNYDGLDPADIGLTNLDVMTGGVDVSPLTLTTTETGADKTKTFEVKLTTQPFFDVIIPIKSLDTNEGTVNKDSLTFTKDDWNLPQTVTVTGVDDNLADGDVTYSVQLGPTTSDDDNYSFLLPSAVSVTNRDVRVATFVVTAISGHTDESGNTAYFDVSLGTPPSADVKIDVSSDTPSEGTIDKGTLTFTKTNWADPQRVTVTGISDNAYDPAHAYNIILAAAVSTDPVYNGADPSDVAVINDDFKKGSVSVSPITGNTDESGQTASVFVSLNYAPAADVTITVSSSNTAEGTVSPTTLTFTSADWRNKAVTVTGVDDNIADGNQTYFINFSKTSSPPPPPGGDNNFDGLDVAPVSVTNVDLVDPYGVTPAISAGAYHNLVLASDGSVWGWGTCASGQLDDGVVPATCSGTYYTLPQRLNISRASAISAGYSFSAIVKADDGSVWTSGVNTQNQLGHASSTSLAQVYGTTGVGSNLTGIKAVSAGAYHVLALKSTGDVWAWGFDGNGQLGNGAIGGNSQNPVPAGGLSGVTLTAIAAGGYHSLAMDDTGKIYAWGSDGNGQLGLGANDQSTATPTQISTLSSATALGAGMEYSFAVGAGGSGTGVYAWGLNDYGQLGINNTTSPQQAPTKVSTITTAARLDGGNQHSIAWVGTNVYAWGDNDDKSATGPDKSDNRGALGRGNTTDSTIPVLFNAASSAMDVSAGFTHSLVLLSSDGRLQTSGLNDTAQLGTNEIASGLDQYTATPTFVEDPGDTGKGTSTYFYAYRPILSGQPATETTINSATVTVCASSVSAYCKNIAYYDYSTDGIYWHDPASVTSSPTISLTNLPLGTITLYVRGYTSTNSALQTSASAAKVSWKVVAP